MNRRKFLGNTTKNLALAGFFGLSQNSLTRNLIKTNDTGDQQAGARDKMIYRSLGKTGIKLPIVSMGVMNADNPALLRAAWEAGIRFFDTAWYYQNGNNEKMVGSVLREVGAKREDVSIGTKILLPGPVRGKEAKEMFLTRFDQSLSRLQMDFVDILYYHMPAGLDQINDPYILEAFTELKEKRKIRFSGFSTHSYWPDLVDDAARREFYDVILLSFNFSMYNDPRVFDSIERAHNAGIGLVAMKTQCQQGWYKRGLPAEQQTFYSKTNMNTALLKWVLKNEYIATAVPGFTTFDQIREDITVAYDLEYTEEEKKFLSDKNVKLAIQSVCRQCGTCIASCAKNVDVPTLMRIHMYGLGYGNLLMAKMTLDQIEQGRSIDSCSNCITCTSKCRFSVPVSERINELKEIYC